LFTITPTPTTIVEGIVVTPPAVVVETVYVAAWPQDRIIAPNQVVVVKGTPINTLASTPQIPPSVIIRNPFSAASTFNAELFSTWFGVVATAAFVAFWL
jgi:hypothetical protein